MSNFIPLLIWMLGFPLVAAHIDLSPQESSTGFVAGFILWIVIGLLCYLGS